ncbi:unnamed protein product [Coccothraustes coccothraustes]
MRLHTYVGRKATAKSCKPAGKGDTGSSQANGFHCLVLLFISLAELAQEVVCSHPVKAMAKNNRVKALERATHA